MVIHTKNKDFEGGNVTGVTATMLHVTNVSYVTRYSTFSQRSKTQNHEH